MSDGGCTLVRMNASTNTSTLEAEPSPEFGTLTSDLEAFAGRLNGHTWVGSPFGEALVERGIREILDRHGVQSDPVSVTLVSGVVYRALARQVLAHAAV